MPNLLPHPLTALNKAYSVISSISIQDILDIEATNINKRSTYLLEEVNVSLTPTFEKKICIKFVFQLSQPG